MWGQLNVKMDSLAKACWNDTYDNVQPFYLKANYGWSLWINERKLSSWNCKELYNHAQSIKILQDWSQRQKIPQQLIQSIDWEAGQNAVKQLGLNRTLWIPKWLAGFAPVGTMLNAQDVRNLKLPNTFYCAKHQTHNNGTQ
jgi:hypothetical protein